jgi:DNA-binding transcriptional ArsR family regulator
MIEPPGPFDVMRFRLPAGAVHARPRLPRHGRGEAFLRGPIHFDWVAAACRLPGSGPHVALAIRLLRDCYARTEGWGVATIAAALSLSARSVRRGLHAAEDAGLVVALREPGCKLSLAVATCPPGPDPGPDRPPLYGPVPASWLVPALLLPAEAVRAAMACWLIAGRGPAAEVELAMGGWEDLGLSRQAAGRGLEALETAGLVASRPGRSPVVLVWPAPAGEEDR